MPKKQSNIHPQDTREVKKPHPYSRCPVASIGGTVPEGQKKEKHDGECVVEVRVPGLGKRKEFSTKTERRPKNKA